MANRVLAFVRRAVGLEGAPAPPPMPREAPGAYALFMDENEVGLLYSKPWPFVGCPTDERTNTTQWLIDGQVFGPSRRDAQGNWIFRRCGRA